MAFQGFLTFSSHLRATSMRLRVTRTRLRTNRSRLRATPYVCARPQMDGRTCKRLCARSLVCARPAFFLSTMDLGLTCQLHISYQVPPSKLKKKLVKFFLHANVHLKRTDRQVCPSVCVLNRRLNLLVCLVRQP